jgi:hypothetical protein
MAAATEWTTATDRRRRRGCAEEAAPAGLENWGENNCFLNSAVQVLFSLGQTRRAVRALLTTVSKTHSSGDAATLVRELAAVFDALASRALPVNLSKLRPALQAFLVRCKSSYRGIVDLSRLRLGDAAEALELLVVALDKAERDLAGTPCTKLGLCITPPDSEEPPTKVALSISNLVLATRACTACGRASEDESPTTHLSEHIAAHELVGLTRPEPAVTTPPPASPAPAKAWSARRVWTPSVPDPVAIPTDRALAQVARSTDPLRSCEHCGEVGKVQSARRLLRGGEALLVQVGWDPRGVEPATIAAVKAAMADEYVDLTTVFEGGIAAAEAASWPARLRAAVLFRDKHFLAVRDVGTGPTPTWAVLDDGTVRSTPSPWDFCDKTGYLPFLLAFEAVGPDTPIPPHRGRRAASLET